MRGGKDLHELWGGKEVDQVRIQVGGGTKEKGGGGGITGDEQEKRDSHTGIKEGIRGAKM